VNSTFWLQMAGHLTWLVCGIPGAVDIVTGRMPPDRAIPWAIAFVAFGAALTVCDTRFGLISGGGGEAARPWRILLFALQAISALVVVWAGRDGLPAAMLVVLAAQLHDVFDTRGTLVWVSVQSLALVVLFWAMRGPVNAIAVGGAFAGFQMFAVATAWLAHSERAARQALARTNAELTAARELLAENSRVSERLRISRDLHDALGHHLTALSLQLEVASRITDGPAAEHVREAHAITRLLLSDVRDVVSRLRGGSRIDLAQAVRVLAVQGGALRIHLDMPEHLAIDDAAQGHALLRCVQEVITNASRHASASNLWIRIDQRDDGIHLQARDDGRGAAELRWGNGLIGMRERFEEYAGRVEIRSAAGQGFEVHGFMPRSEALA
jgi:signal transduction histidine kinase